MWCNRGARQRSLGGDCGISFTFVFCKFSVKITERGGRTKRTYTLNCSYRSYLCKNSWFFIQKSRGVEKALNPVEKKGCFCLRMPMQFSKPWKTATVYMMLSVQTAKKLSILSEKRGAFCLRMPMQFSKPWKTATVYMRLNFSVFTKICSPTATAHHHFTWLPSYAEALFP